MGEYELDERKLETNGMAFLQSMFRNNTDFLFTEYTVCLSQFTNYSQITQVGLE